MSDAKPVFETTDFSVTVETISTTDIPAERRRAYFIRHKAHAVVHMVTPLFGEAVMSCVALQKGTEAVLENPENPDLLGALPGGASKGGSFGLN